MVCQETLSSTPINRRCPQEKQEQHKKRELCQILSFKIFEELSSILETPMLCLCWSSVGFTISIGFTLLAFGLKATI